jgi:hypothetical protein
MRGAILPRLGQKPIRRRTALIVSLALLLLALAWYQGGERALRPIEQDISVPEGAL